MLRVKEKETAELLLSQLPMVKIKSLVDMSSVVDTAHGSDDILFLSKNEDRIDFTDIPLLSINDVISLPKGQAFCLIDGGKLYKVRMPLPKNDNTHHPQTVEGMAEIMNQQQ